MRIYILKLVNNKWYIGKSKNVKKRFKTHKNGYGAQWTKLYKPIKIEKVINTNCNYDEDKQTKKMMAKYGIDNVRGGSYSKINLCDNTKFFINKEIQTAEDRCFICGESGHFASNCEK